MSYNPVQGSFVGRTKTIDRAGQFTATQEVPASTTYEPTGSFQSTAFFVGCVKTSSFHAEKSILEIA